MIKNIRMALAGLFMLLAAISPLAFLGGGIYWVAAGFDDGMAASIIRTGCVLLGTPVASAVMFIFCGALCNLLIDVPEDEHMGDLV